MRLPSAKASSSRFFSLTYLETTDLMFGCRSFKVFDQGFSAMPKRGIGNDFESQPGNYNDGDASDSNTSNPFGGTNFGGAGVSGRK